VPALRIRARRLGYRVAHRLLRGWWFVRRPHTQGVKCLLFDGERVLFVRHAYGDRKAWELPGGGLRRGEEPALAARREMREELGVDLDCWAPSGSTQTTGLHKTVTLHLFRAPVRGERIELGLAELEEARWADPSAPPMPLGRDAAAVLAFAGLVVNSEHK
jgi:8-oxo-dGTP pyrophosphatase MutT (NUDIX family)